MARQPLRSYLVPFLDYCEIEKGLSNHTQRNYRQYLRIFFPGLRKPTAPICGPAS